MARLTAFAIAVAERIEARGGPRAALVVWRSLARQRGDDRLQQTAHLAALRCAFAAGQLVAFDDLVRQWRPIGGASRDEDIVACCRRVARGGELRRALALAEAECERIPTALALYLHARCLDVLRDGAATRAFERAAERAQREGVRAIERATRLRRLALLSRSWSTMSEAFAEALRVPLEDAPPGAFIDVADVLLLSPSRFDRATALGHLDHIVATASNADAQRALWVVTHWVDRLGESITPIEADRLFALLARERVVRSHPTLRDLVRALLASLDMQGGAVATDEELATAARRIGEITPGEPRAWNVARVALDSPDGATRSAGAKLVSASLREAKSTPRGGFLSLAEAVARNGDPALADELYRAALARKERGASEAQGLALCRAGWRLAESGARADAIRALREAKALLCV